MYGVLTWLIPFCIAVPFYSRDGQLLIDIFLFKSIMIIVGSATGAFFLLRYFMHVTNQCLREGVVLGLSWLVINLLLDFAVLIPMTGMSLEDYSYQIGLRYLTIPIFSVAIGLALEHNPSKV